MKLFTAFRFLTIIPFPASREQSLEEHAGAIPYYPVVGALIGALLYLLGMIPLWSSPALSALVLACWVIITGGLHLDGAADLADGWAGGRTPEDMVRIMRDSRIGAFGVIALALLLLVKFTMIGELLTHQLLYLLPAVTMIGRTTAVAAIRVFPSASSVGMGAAFKNSCRTSHLASAVLFTLGVSWLLWGAAGVLLFLAVGVFMLLGCSLVSRKLKGLTGDVYGAVIEYSEVIALILIIPLREVLQ